MRAIPLVLVMLLSALVAPVAVQAQVLPEIRPFVGALVPTGDQRDVFDVALLTGGQAALEVADMLHVVGTFAFSGPDFDAQVSRAGHMHIYQADLGGELFRDIPMGTDWKFRPFLGLGVGVRTYDPTSSGESRSYPAGYGALGTEFQLNRFAVRFEARDYLTRFEGLSGNDEASTRNDLGLSAGLALHLW